jgi:hypothetical protein
LTKYTTSYLLAYHWSVGSIIVTTSESAPLSAMYRIQKQPLGIGYVLVAVPLTTTLVAAHDLDSRLYPGRSARMKQEVRIAPSYNASTATQVQSINWAFAIQQTGWGQAPLDNIVGAPVMPYWTFKDQNCLVACSGEYVLFKNDVIQVDYGCPTTGGQICSGYTQQWQFEGAIRDNGKWLALWGKIGELLYQGKPVTPPTTAPGTPIPGFGDESGYNAWGGGGQLHIIWDPVQCWGSTSITITFDDGTSYTSFGAPICGQP